jgi:hypothetical protein
MLTITILLSAPILFYALRKKRDVTFALKVWGANVLLEAKGDDRPHSDSRPPV